MVEGSFREFAIKQQDRWRSMPDKDRLSFLMPAQFVHGYWNTFLKYLPPYIPADLKEELRSRPDPIVLIKPLASATNPPDIPETNMEVLIEDTMIDPEEEQLYIDGQLEAGEYVNDILVMDTATEMATRHPNPSFRQYFTQLQQARGDRYHRGRAGFSRLFKGLRHTEIDQLQRDLLMSSLTGQGPENTDLRSLFVTIGKAGNYPWPQRLPAEPTQIEFQIRRTVPPPSRILGTASLIVPGLITMATLPLVTRPFQKPQVEFVGTLFHEMGHYLSHRTDGYGLLDVRYSTD